MPFPETERIVYQNNPLIEVICQLRFPPILSIESEIPAKFQDAIRNVYQTFQEKVEIQAKLPDEIKTQVPMEFLNIFPTQGAKKNYEFSTIDEKYKVNLTRTFLALTSYDYRRWEEFTTYFNIVFDAFVKNYSPAFFTRIGLRYKDLIDKTQLNLRETPWGELLKPQIAGVLIDTNISQHVISTSNTVMITLSDETSVVRIQHGLVNAEGHKDISYLIDSDFYTEHRTSIDQAITKLNYFNQRGTRLLRWCITDTLHNALGPEII